MKAYRQEKALEQRLNFELYFVSEVLHLPSLHYGYWDKGQSSGKIDLDEIRKAQARFTRELLSFIPEGTESVLDVGAGIGDVAKALSEEGYKVTAISPDRNHAPYFAKLRDRGIAFQQCTFEAFRSQQPFDLLLFSESINYFDRHVGLQQCRRLIRPGGHLVVSGKFRDEQGAPFPDNFNLEDLEYIRLAKKYDFTPRKIVDITENVLPTMEIFYQALENYVEPIVEFADQYLRARAPWKEKALKFLLSRQKKKLEDDLSEYRQTVNPDYFRRHIRYVTILLQDTAQTGNETLKPN